MQYEGLRPWVMFRAEDITQSASSSDNFTVAKTLASDFSEWFDEAPIQLIKSDGNASYLREVSFSDRYQYRNSAGRFCVDYANSLFYLLGS